MATGRSAVRVDPPPVPLSHAERLERIVVAALVVLLGTRMYIGYELSVAILCGAALIPVWWRCALRHSGAGTLMLGLGMSLLAGIWLSIYSAPDHGVVTRQRILNLVLVFSLAVGIGVIVWARTLIRDSTIALLFGIGMLAGLRVNAGFLDNPWKFGFDKPLSLILLALACRSRGRLVAPAALLVLVALGTISGARSRSGILLVALVIAIWQTLPPSRHARGAATRVIAYAGALSYATYQIGQSILLEGALGSAAQARTQEQIDQSGSLLLGGRPEIGATWALMRDRFEGLGFGVGVNQHELAVAKSGMAATGYDPENGYVSNFMFGDGVELHSGLGDLWAYMGPVGLVVGIGLMALVIWRLGEMVAVRKADAFLLMLALTILWDMAFSPLKSGFPFLVLGLGMLLRFRPKERMGPTASPALSSAGVELNGASERRELHIPLRARAPYRRGGC